MTDEPKAGTPLEAIAGRKRLAAERLEAKADKLRDEADELDALAARRRITA